MYFIYIYNMYNLYIKYITEARTMFYNSRCLNYQFFPSLHNRCQPVFFSASAVCRFDNYKNFYVPYKSYVLS